MYSREIDDEILTFASVGILYEDTFVLFDEETESLWYHLEGDVAMTGISGEYSGSRTAELPFAYTTWKEWRERHSDTGYLDAASLPSRSADRRRRGNQGQTGQSPGGAAEGQRGQVAEGDRPAQEAPPGRERSTRRDRVDQGQD